MKWPASVIYRPCFSSSKSWYTTLSYIIFSGSDQESLTRRNEMSAIINPLTRAVLLTPDCNQFGFANKLAQNQDPPSSINMMPLVMCTLLKLQFLLITIFLQQCCSSWCLSKFAFLTLFLVSLLYNISLCDLYDEL